MSFNSLNDENDSEQALSEQINYACRILEEKHRKNPNTHIPLADIDELLSILETEDANWAAQYLDDTLNRTVEGRQTLSQSEVEDLIEENKDSWDKDTVAKFYKIYYQMRFNDIAYYYPQKKTIEYAGESGKDLEDLIDYVMNTN